MTRCPRGRHLPGGLHRFPRTSPRSPRPHLTNEFSRRRVPCTNAPMTLRNNPSMLLTRADPPFWHIIDRYRVVHRRCSDWMICARKKC
jgi:hypothetical protein